VPRGDIALGNGEQAGQSGFGGQQVVAAGVQAVVGQAVTDRQQLALGVEQKGEVHIQRHLPCAGSHAAQARLHRCQRLGG